MSLLELLAVLALLGILLGSSLAPLGEAIERARLRSAARDMATTFRLARTEAILRRTSVGVVFERASGYAFRIHVDGNGNGIRTSETRSGVDPCTRSAESIAERYRGVRVGLLSSLAVPRIPPDTGTLAAGADPVQFGASDIVSFSPSGKCTPGTLYLTVGERRVAAVRVLGPIGRVRIWEYETGGSWQPR